MSSLIVPVAEIEAITPHSNADSLELAQVLGWQTVVPKGQHKVGEKIVYFPPDTIIPQELSDRLHVTQYLDRQRIRCTKLRGEPSFGLVIPPDQDWPVGENVAEFYGAIKWEPPQRNSTLRGHTGPARMHPDALPEPPEFWRYTGIENMRHYPNVFETGEQVIVTEKVHGCNVRLGVINGDLMVGSHKVRRKPPKDNDFAHDLYWYPMSLRGVSELLHEMGCAFQQVILYGEIFGPDIQSYHYGMREGEWGFRAFDLLVNGKYVDADFFQATCCSYGIKTVPILATVPYDLAAIRALSEGKTTLITGEGGHIREGVVVRPMQERVDWRFGRVILKYVSDSYLLDRKKSDFSEQ